MKSSNLNEWGIINQGTPEELRKLSEQLMQLAELREKAQALLRSLTGEFVIRNQSKPPPQHQIAPGNNGEIKSVLPNGANHRQPPGPPREGAIRADVYSVLTITPQKCSTIIAEVAKRRHVPQSKQLASTVREVLRDRFDPRIKRTGYGMYALADNGRG